MQRNVQDPDAHAYDQGLLLGYYDVRINGLNQVRTVSKRQYVELASYLPRHTALPLECLILLFTAEEGYPETQNFNVSENASTTSGAFGGFSADHCIVT